MGYFTAEISRHIWDTKYRFREDGTPRDADVTDTWRRIAHALAAVEPADRGGWEQRFYEALEDFRFLPGGRVQAGAGTGRRVTLFNCFVMGPVRDSVDGIFTALKEGALTMQQGGGVGYDFSTLRPRGATARSAGTVASGPVSFMRIWDTMCATLLSTGARRGAMMGTLRCDHPDIEAFIDAKRDPRELRHFNLSVLISDAFVEAIRADEDWPLVFPEEDLGGAGGDAVVRPWPGRPGEVRCRVLRRVPARRLWDRLMRATYDCAEPGVLFIDRINQRNNLYYREWISATNPCGEIPLPAYGACDLGSINLTRFVRRPFTPAAGLDLEEIRRVVPTAVRMLDNVIDASGFPLPAQREAATGARRIGLGVTGLADAFIMLGLRYGAAPAQELAAEVMRVICHEAYAASVGLARGKGVFPQYDRDAYLAGEFVSRLPATLRDAIAADGIRNSHLTAIAPTGTISLLANNVTSGLEPLFDPVFRRRVTGLDGGYRSFDVEDYASALWRELRGDEPLPAQFVDARELEPRVHLDVQAALQPYVDSAISKTVNVPEDYPFERFRSLYDYAYDRQLKGCTTFRPNAVTGSILEVREQAPEHSPHCCNADREAD
jgi:ribonucleoside-diphosphate reductase alpha chain